MSGEQTLDIDTVWLTSGMLETMPGAGYKCQACGGSGGPSPSDVRHAPDCELAASVREIAVLSKAPSGSPGPAGEAEIEAMIAGVSPQDSETISLLLSEIATSSSRAARLEAVHILQEMCPGVPPGSLMQYAVTGISDPQQLAAVKRHLLFERAVAARESAMASELKQLLAAGGRPLPGIPGR